MAKKRYRPGALPEKRTGREFLSRGLDQEVNPIFELTILLLRYIQLGAIQAFLVAYFWKADQTLLGFGWYEFFAIASIALVVELIIRFAQVILLVGWLLWDCLLLLVCCPKFFLFFVVVVYRTVDIPVVMFVIIWKRLYFNGVALQLVLLVRCVLICVDRLISRKNADGTSFCRVLLAGYELYAMISVIPRMTGCVSGPEEAT